MQLAAVEALQVVVGELHWGVMAGPLASRERRQAGREHRQLKHCRLRLGLVCHHSHSLGESERDASCGIAACALLVVAPALTLKCYGGCSGAPPASKVRGMFMHAAIQKRRVPTMSQLQASCLGSEQQEGAGGKGAGFI